MIQRRTFLKLAALGAASIGTGVGAGILTHRPRTRAALHAFVPNDADLAADLVRGFVARLPESGRGASLVLAGGGPLRDAIASACPDAGLIASGRLVVRIEPCSIDVGSDLMLSDGTRGIARPDTDFGSHLTAVRARMRGARAAWFVSADYDARDIVDRLVAPSLVAVVEDERGIVDRIALDDRTRTISVSGPAGRSTFEMSASGARAISAPCRHALCVHRGLVASAGAAVACAPNRALVRIEMA
jgi:hypothetical protein